MNADDPRAKWHPIDEAALKALSEGTSTPGIVYPMFTNQMPLPLQSMPGVASYFVSGYSSAVPLANGMTAGAEFVAVRTGDNLAKAYNYLVATGTNGLVYYNGPHKNFSQHHFDSSSPVKVEQLFGNVPTKNNGAL